MRPIVRILAALTCAALAVGAGKPLPAKPHPNWLATFAADAEGRHVLGNPAAKVKLTEYVSYTCSHCAHFYVESDVALRLGAIQPGTVSLTINNVIRNPVDLTVAMLTECGDPKQFFRRHGVFFSTQSTWLARANRFAEAQQQRWYTGDEAARLRAIAHDFDFYSVVAQWGITRAKADTCLADAKVRDRIKVQHGKAIAEGVQGTPSFSLNGVLLADAYDWPTLQTAIKERLTPGV
jgi:protein-disulfide isomerase